MTPEKWSAMQTAANQSDAHAWIVVVGWAVVIAAGIVVTMIATAGAVRTVMWARWRWAQHQETRRDRLWTGSQGRTWR